MSDSELACNNGVMNVPSSKQSSDEYRLKILTFHITFNINLFPKHLIWLHQMSLREKLGDALIYTFCCWTVCVCVCVPWILSDRDLREVRVFQSAQCCDIQSLWRGEWVIVGLEEENPGKESDSHRRITDHWHISALWYLTDMIVWLQHCWHWYIFCSRWLSLSNASSCRESLQLKKLQLVEWDQIICLVSFFLSLMVYRRGNTTATQCRTRHNIWQSLCLTPFPMFSYLHPALTLTWWTKAVEL